jgi:hypothetical protein
VPEPRGVWSCGGNREGAYFRHVKMPRDRMLFSSRVIMSFMRSRCVGAWVHEAGGGGRTMTNCVNRLIEMCTDTSTGSTPTHHPGVTVPTTPYGLPSSSVKQIAHPSFSSFRLLIPFMCLLLVSPICDEPLRTRRDDNVVHVACLSGKIRTSE